MDADDFRYWYDHHLKAKIMGKYQRKKVWLFVNAMSMIAVARLLNTGARGYNHPKSVET